METIKFKLLHPEAKLPVRAHETDACYDVVATSRIIRQGYIEYGLGFATEIPVGWEGHFYARSSVSNKDVVLCNGTARIDADYRGEWLARFRRTPAMTKGGYSVKAGDWDDGEYNITMREVGDYAKLYEVGDRIGQIQFRKLDQYELVLADELSDTNRGTGGFGSTGN